MDNKKWAVLVGLFSIIIGELFVIAMYLGRYLPEIVDELSTIANRVW